MVTAGDFLQGLLDSWEGYPCPYCGQEADPWYLSIISSYTICCSHCDKVIEAFELYQDEEGNAETRNHWAADR
jgi:hypothetical protein